MLAREWVFTDSWSGGLPLLLKWSVYADPASIRHGVARFMYMYAKGIVRQSVPWRYELCMKWSFYWEFSPMQSLNMCNQRWRRWVHSSYSTRSDLFLGNRRIVICHGWMVEWKKLKMRWKTFLYLGSLLKFWNTGSRCIWYFNDYYYCAIITSDTNRTL